MKPDFGTDISVYGQPPTLAAKRGTPGLNRNLRLVSGRDNLIEALMKRLETPRGWLAKFGGDPDYGKDISDILNSKWSPTLIAAEETDIQVEMEKDDRVRSAQVKITLPLTTSRMLIEIRILPKTGGPFKFVLAPGERATLDLIKVEPA